MYYFVLFIFLFHKLKLTTCVAFNLNRICRIDGYTKRVDECLSDRYDMELLR